MATAAVPDELLELKDMKQEPVFDHGKSKRKSRSRSKKSSSGRSEQSEESCGGKIAAKACPPWLICLCACLVSYALRLSDGGERTLMLKFVSLQLLTGGLAILGTYGSIFYIYPSKYAVCIAKEDQGMYLEYKVWFARHKQAKAEPSLVRPT